MQPPAGAGSSQRGWMTAPPPACNASPWQYTLRHVAPSQLGGAAGRDGGRERAKRDLRGAGDRDAGMEDVAVVIPARGHDVALRARNAAIGVDRVRLARRPGAMTRGARGGPFAVAAQTRHLCV